MSRLSDMKAADLTLEQVKYELRVRGRSIEELETSGPLADQLQAILVEEVANQKDPLEWELNLTEEQKDQELESCVSCVRELRTTFWDHELDDTLAWDNFVVSRLVHSDYRLKRIQYDGTSEDTRIAAKKQEVAAGWIRQMFAQLDSASHQPANQRPESFERPPPRSDDTIEIEDNGRRTDRTSRPDRSTHQRGGSAVEYAWSPNTSGHTFQSSEYLAKQNTPPRPATARGAAKWAREQDAHIAMSQLLHVEDELKKEFRRTEPRQEYTNSMLHRLKLAHDQIEEISRKITEGEEETSRLVDDAFDKWEQLDRWAVSKIVGARSKASKTTASSTLQENVRNKKKSTVSFDTYIDEIGFDSENESTRNRRDLSQKCVSFEDESPTDYPSNAMNNEQKKEEEMNTRLWPPRKDSDSSAEVEDDDMSHSRPGRSWGSNGSTSWQQQMQALSKAMGHRRFDGERSDQKLLSVAEFIGLLRMYQQSARITDSVLLRAVPTQLTGRAFLWWATVGGSIETFSQFERAVRLRFEHREMDKISQIVHVTARKQQKSEQLADYVDDMCQLALSLEERMTEHQLVKLIIKNASMGCRQQLVAHRYKTVEELRHYVNYLGANGLVPVEPVESKPDTKPKWIRPKYVNATEKVEQKSSSASDDETSGEEHKEAVEAKSRELAEKLVAAVAKAFSQPRFDRSRRLDKKREEREEKENIPTGTTPLLTAEQMMTEVRCYGCQTPGVYRRDCVKCNPHLAKNGQADL